MRPPESDRRIFVDTSAFYATIDRHDAAHTATVATMGQIIETRRLITTNTILFELHGLLLGRLGRQIAYSALVELWVSQTVVRVRAKDEARAAAILAQYDDKNFSLTDASSFAVMERLGVGVAFTLDRHFVQFGWEVIPLEAGRRGD